VPAAPTHVWPALLASTRIAGNPRLWRVRVSHRLLGLWLAISALPLSAVALTTSTRVAGLDLATHPVLGRLVSVILLIAASAAVGGAWLAWLVSRSVGPTPRESRHRHPSSGATDELTFAARRRGYPHCGEPRGVTEQQGGGELEP
jgi:hypothetical protein